MRRFAAMCALAVLIFTQAVQPADGAVPGCCICSACASGPSFCSLPLNGCETACAQAGCTEFTTGMGPECDIPLCGASETAPAPALGGLGITAVTAALVAIGLLGLRRRRARHPIRTTSR